MATIEDRKTYFAKLQNIFRDKTFLPKNLKITLTEIQIVLSFKGGLLNDELRILAIFLCNTNLSPIMIDEIMKCMVPKEPVSYDIIDMFLVVIFSRRKTSTHLRFSRLILQWLLSVLDFGFAQLEALQDYYYLFYSLLNYYELSDYACKMIYKLTSPTDVTEISILKVIKKKQHFGKNSKKLYMDALLESFANFRPDYIDPEDIKEDINIEETFQNLPQEFTHLFSMVHGKVCRHLQTCHKALVPIIRLEGNFQEVSIIPSKVKKVNRLIPPITHSFGMIGKLSALHFESIGQLGMKVIDIAIPDQILSLLNNQVGHFKLMTCEEKNQRRFASRLYDTLKQTFIEKKDVTSVEEKECFLEEIISLCNFMQQGISTCTTFVGEYLLTWSGLDFRSQILRLIEWVVVDSYSELFPILRSLHVLFVTSDMLMKCQIIETLTNLVGNMAKMFYRFSNGIAFPFMKSQTPNWLRNPTPMFQNTIRFIENLIQIGLCLEPKSTKYLDSAISFYECVSNFEEIFGLHLLIIPFEGVIYHCFFNKNVMFLDRVAGLLLRYKEQYDNLTALGLQTQFERQIEYCNLYVNDIVNTFFLGKALTRRGDGIIFELLTRKMIADVYHLSSCSPDSLFELHNYMSIIPLLKMRNDNVSTEEDFKSLEDRYNLLEMYAGNVAKLMDLVPNGK